VASFAQAAGTFTGSTSYTLTDSGNFLAGTLTNAVLKLQMTGDGTTYTASSNRLFSFRASANVTVTGSGSEILLTYSGATSFIIDTGKTVTIANGKALVCWTTSTSALTNNGIIVGAGTGFFSFRPTATKTVSFGVINCPVLIFTESGISSIVTTVGTSTTFGSTIAISSNDATNTCALDLSASNYALSCAGLTVGTRAILNARASLITCSGNFDSSAGTFTEGTSTVEMTGASKTLKTGAGQSFYNLDISGTISTTSSVNVTHDLDVSGTLTNGAGKTMTWVSNGTMTNTGEIAGTGEFAIDLATDYAITLGTVTAPTTVGIPSWRTTDGTLSWAVDTTLRADLTIEGNATLDPNDMITIFADDMELDLSASPSSELWNATVNAGVTVTLTDDVIVQLRVTILGTVAGADFIEPEPAFTSTPDLTATPLTVY